MKVIIVSLLVIAVAIGVLALFVGAFIHGLQTGDWMPLIAISLMAMAFDLANVRANVGGA